MEQKNNGGPAFPVLNDGHHRLANMAAGQRLAEGMTLRDYFAAKALPTLLVDGMACTAVAALAERMGGDMFKAAANTAYRIADSMLAERAK